MVYLDFSCASRFKNGVKMKFSSEALSVCVLFIFFARTNGLCQYADSHPTITSCEENKSGQNVFVDFQRINHSCTCIVESFFTGYLLVQMSLTTKLQSCKEKVVASSQDKITYFKCDAVYPISDTFSVEANYTAVKITTDYKAEFSLDYFYPCLLLNENGGKGGAVSVTCGNLTTDTNAKSTTTTTAATASTSKPETNLSTTTYETTTVVVFPPQKSTYTSSDNVTYIIAGAAGGALVLVVVVIVLVAIIFLRKRKGRKNSETQRTDVASEHTNNAFDENNYDLPENPLYHSAQLMDEVGYSSVQKNQLGLPPTEATIKKYDDPYYDVPTNNKPINDSDTSQMPIYAVPNKSGAPLSEKNEPQAIYAQVSKQSKSTAPVPMQSINQDGLVYLETEKDATSVNKNSPYTKNENKDGVLYAEIKRN